MKIQSSPMWPTMFHAAEYDDAADHKEALKALCYRLRDAGERWGIAARSKHSLFESKPNLFDAPEAAPLRDFCAAVIAELFRAKAEFRESWCHITNDGGYHDAHTHIDYARGGICGIYYLESGQCTADPPNGVNRFFSPDVHVLGDVADFVPKDGRLILFPGHVRHSATPYSGETDRIVISFNALLRKPR
jgi:hypothetical protein